MARKFQAIKTPVGYIKGRDAIFLGDVIFSKNMTVLTLGLGLSLKLCSESEEEVAHFGGGCLKFIDILAVKIIELDSWDWDSESCFDEIIDSEWIQELGGKVESSHRHFLVQTYDHVFEVVCREYTFGTSTTDSTD